MAIGLVLRLGGSLAATRLLEEVLLNMRPADAASFAGVGVFFSLAALIACVIPSWRAMRVDPVIAMQRE